MVTQEDYQYFKDHYNLIAVDLSKQKELDAHSRAIQQIENFREIKRNSARILQRNSKSFVNNKYKWLSTVKQT